MAARAVLMPAALLLAAGSVRGERIVLPLDGTWSVGESMGAKDVPAHFGHTVAVPGLTNQAQPAFPDVDQYQTHDYVGTMVKWGVWPPSEKYDGLGRTPQKRNYFWYERTFTAPVRRQRAVLVVNKAQFGTAVWLNGKMVGEHLGCFTAGRFDVTGAIRWNAENRLRIRIGAHPAALPKWAFWGTDGEKPVWTPGIYDNVSLVAADNPVIESVQVAPRIQTSEIVVQTRLKNFGPACSVDLSQRVKTWKGERPAGQPLHQRIELGAGEERTLTQTVRVPNATLWCPENPFLYVLESATGGDGCTTRFGMREFRFDTATRRAMLNGKICYLRGASITLHRFFGDPHCGGLPWDEKWVRKFLVEIPKQMHWNAFRICIGPAPQQWLDVADEAGLLLQYEFPIWSDRPATSSGLMHHQLWRENDIVEQVREFVRDNWNHPSVALWDASNETHWDFLREKLIPAVRGLDLSARPWENGYNKPQGPDDPQEDHPYLCGSPTFQLTDLEKMTRRPPHGAHAGIINEYDWLWLHRDGTPTELTRKVYEHLAGSAATPDQRRRLYAYVLGGLTEFWRTHRQYAGVMYLAYLDGDLPNCFTCDNFRDVERLELDPYFRDYMGEAFKPLGIYVNFWQPELPPATERRFPVLMVNDTDEPMKGKLELVWEPERGGAAVGRTQTPFAISALGQAAFEVVLAAPKAEGKYLLRASASCDGKSWSPTVSRRKVRIVSPLRTQ